MGKISLAQLSGDLALENNKLSFLQQDESPLSAAFQGRPRGFQEDKPATKSGFVANAQSLHSSFDLQCLVEFCTASYKESYKH